MTEYWQIWVAIAVAGIVTYLLRAAPLLIFKEGEADSNRPFFRFLEYTVFAVLGGIVGTQALSLPEGTSLQEIFSSQNLVSLLTLVGVFLLFIRLKQLILCLFIGLVFYQILLYFSVWLPTI